MFFFFFFYNLPPNSFFQFSEPQFGEEIADLFSDHEHIVHHVLGLSIELGSQNWVLKFCSKNKKKSNLKIVKQFT